MDTKTIAERFYDFDRAHPDIYREFKRIAETALARRSRFGADAIIQIIRWERLTSNDGAHDSGFKINDHFSAYYARKLMGEDARFLYFFETRRLRAA